MSRVYIYLHNNSERRDPLLFKNLSLGARVVLSILLREAQNSRKRYREHQKMRWVSYTDLARKLGIEVDKFIDFLNELIYKNFIIFSNNRNANGAIPKMYVKT